MLINYSSLVKANTNDAYTSEDFTFYVIYENVDGSKIELKNKETGEINWIETYFEEGVRTIKNTSNISEEVLLLKDYESYGTISMINGQDIIYQDTINFIDDNQITLNAYGPWSNSTWQYSSRATRLGNYSNVVSVIMLITGAPAYASAVKIAVDYIINNHVKNVYYKTRTQYRFDYSKDLYQGRRVTMMYSDSSYRNLISSYTDTWTGRASNH